MRLYQLIDREVIESSDSPDYWEWYCVFANRTVAMDIVAGAMVSTVFLGIDHSLQETGAPLVFETMVFSYADPVYCERTSTYDEAIEEHQIAIRWTKKRAR